MSVSTNSSVSGVLNLTASQAAAVAAMTSGDVITVGTGGEYSTLEAAAEAAHARTRNIDRWARVLIMPNSTLTLSAEADFPEFCEVVGVSRATSRVLASGNNNLKYRKWNRFQNFRLDYSGTGGSSGAFNSSSGITAQAYDKSTLDFIDLDVNVTANHRSGIYTRTVALATIRGCRIVTSGIGVEVTSGHNIHIRDTEIYLDNVDTGYPHYGIKHLSSSGRVTVWGGKISTGYGLVSGGNDGIVGEADQDIVGIYSGATSGSTRMDIFEMWSIIRNSDGANAGKKCVCVWNDSNYNVTRVWSAYLQVENATDSSVGDNYEILNTGVPTSNTGTVLVAPGVRARRVGGAVYSTGPFLGYPNVVTANTTLAISRGGLHRVNAAAGDITITLPNPLASFTPNITHSERYLFKRVVSAANTITISATGAGVTIEGAATVVLGGALYSQVELVWSSADSMWLKV